MTKAQPNNLTLWQAVEKTPLNQQKQITGKAYKGNSPKPHYLVHKATEMFGPCGIGWGFDIVDEQLLDGALLEPGFFEKIHTARIKVWYKWEGERGEVEHVGQTQFCGRRNNGNTFTDEDAPKKSVTDALVKALSMIGFAGDIFSGRYDDSKYQQELREDAKQASAKPPEPPQDDEPTEQDRENLESVKLALNACKDVAALRDLAASDLFRQSVKGLHPMLREVSRSAYTARNNYLKAEAEKTRIENSNDELMGNDKPTSAAA